MTQLYIFRFLHQTTTPWKIIVLSVSCISFVSYIKPQLLTWQKHNHTVVYLSFPTSNHNLFPIAGGHKLLYIFRFLHQTTTGEQEAMNHNPLYIFRFLHQTTTKIHILHHNLSCISFVSYIKPQLVL